MLVRDRVPVGDRGVQTSSVRSMEHLQKQSDSVRQQLTPSPRGLQVL
jgi:hypothetical protein